jgi:hypothetical protein
LVTSTQVRTWRVFASRPLPTCDRCSLHRIADAQPAPFIGWAGDAQCLAPAPDDALADAPPVAYGGRGLVAAGPCQLLLHQDARAAAAPRAWQRGQGIGASLQPVTTTSPSRGRQFAWPPRARRGGLYGPCSGRSRSASSISPSPAPPGASACWQASQALDPGAAAAAESRQGVVQAGHRLVADLPGPLAVAQLDGRAQVFGLAALAGVAAGQRAAGVQPVGRPLADQQHVQLRLEQPVVVEALGGEPRPAGTGSRRRGRSWGASGTTPQSQGALSPACRPAPSARQALARCGNQCRGVGRGSRLDSRCESRGAAVAAELGR